MATITFKGSDVHTNGELPKVGTDAPDFKLVQTDLSEFSLADLRGKQAILNIFPSTDTTVCALSVRKFNEQAATLENTVVLAISRDLPFAHARFCAAEGIKNVKPLSTFRCRCFEEHYGVLITDGPLQGLLARAVVVIDAAGKIAYTELVPEVTHEPDYDRAIAALKCSH